MDSWIRNYYGSRRGLARVWWARAQNAAGLYRVYRSINWNETGRLVFICKGNICRSAYAEARAAQLGAKSASYGLATQPGLPANEQAIEAAQRRGIALNTHRTAPIEDYQPEAGDLLLAMEPVQGARLKEMYGNSPPSTLLGLWMSPETPHIQDPYGALPDYFNHCFNSIDNAIDEILGKIGKKD